MHVIAALDRHRDRIAQRRGHDIRPWPEANDRLARQQRPLLRLDAITGAGRPECLGVAAQKPAAALLEQRFVSLGQRQRVGNRGRVEIMHGADAAMQRRLEFAQLPGRIKRGFQAKWRDLVRRRAALGKGFLAAKQFQPAGLAQKARAPRLGHELFMFAKEFSISGRTESACFSARSGALSHQ